MNQIDAVTANSTAPAYIPASVNFTSGGGTPATTNINPVADTTAVDPRRYSQFDRTASNVGSATMSFGDFLDMINPLQHIPVVSSVYRAVTGDKINPVSHVVGDVMYGGIMGVAAAIAGGVGAIADSVMEEKTGKGVMGTMYAGLFGDDKEAAGDGNTQIASASPAPSSPSPGKASEIETALLSSDPAKASAAAAGQGFPLNRNKMPYGGALAPVKDMQTQNMAMAVASATGGIRIGNTVYANRLIHGGRALPPAPLPAPADAAPAISATTADTGPLITALPQNTVNATPVPNGALTASIAIMTPAPSAAPAPASVTSSNVNSDTVSAEDATTIPAALRDDAMVMRALGLYQNVANSAGGASVH